MIDAFLAICVHIISTVKQGVSNRAIKILFAYLKNDQKVFNRFKVNRLIVRKMKLVEYMFSQSQEVADMALDFSSFLLRYNRELDYQDFADDQTIIAKIKKAETYRTWADIEDLANTLSALQGQVTETQLNVQNAMQEMHQGLEKFKKDE